MSPSEPSTILACPRPKLSGWLASSTGDAGPRSPSMENARGPAHGSLRCRLGTDMPLALSASKSTPAVLDAAGTWETRTEATGVVPVGAPAEIGASDAAGASGKQRHRSERVTQPPLMEPSCRKTMAASSFVAKAPPAPVLPQPRTPSSLPTMSAGRSVRAPSDGAATVRPPFWRRTDGPSDRPSRAGYRACRSTPSTATPPAQPATARRAAAAPLRSPSTSSVIAHDTSSRTPSAASRLPARRHPLRQTRRKLPVNRITCNRSRALAPNDSRP